LTILNLIFYIIYIWIIKFKSFFKIKFCNNNQKQTHKIYWNLKLSEINRIIIVRISRDKKKVIGCLKYL
jgi:hypothetical protein